MFFTQSVNEVLQLQCCPFIKLSLRSIGMDHVLSELFCKGTILQRNYLRNEFDFWKVHGIMNTSGLLQSK